MIMLRLSYMIQKACGDILNDENGLMITWSTSTPVTPAGTICGKRTAPTQIAMTRRIGRLSRHCAGTQAGVSGLLQAQISEWRFCGCKFTFTAETR